MEGTHRTELSDLRPATFPNVKVRITITLRIRRNHTYIRTMSGK
jgi:hypothetical protein